MPIASPEASGPDETPATSSGLCILCVEDNDADAYLICRALADNPAVGEVVHARDGVEALAMIESGKVAPALAFIDLRMPRMDGFDLLVAVATRPRLGFPMVVLTSSGSPDDAIRSRLRGATRVIAKPAAVTELYAVLKAAIEAICPGGRAGIAPPSRNPGYQRMGQESRGLRRLAPVGDDQPSQ
jgi:CheY-like chemotaxis protein